MKNRQDFPKAEKEAFIYKCCPAYFLNFQSHPSSLGLSFLEDLRLGERQ